VSGPTPEQRNKKVSNTPGEKSIKVFLVDESTLAHAGITHILESHQDIELVGCTGGESAELEFCLDSSADVVVINPQVRSDDVPELIRRVARLHDSGFSRVLLLANDVRDSAYAEALRSGIGGIVFTHEPAQVLVSALRVVASGYAVSMPAMRTPVGNTPQKNSLDLLTLRERQVLILIARGLKNSDIALKLVLSESTVKTHVQNILVKLGINNRSSAVAIAYEWGVLGMDPSR
jgi:DNA-binding NarL/FixJ family response regulator